MEGGRGNEQARESHQSGRRRGTETPAGQQRGPRQAASDNRNPQRGQQTGQQTGPSQAASDSRNHQLGQQRGPSGQGEQRNLGNKEISKQMGKAKSKYTQASANIRKNSDEGTSTGGSMVGNPRPVHTPDRGKGKLGGPINLLVNHFKVEFERGHKIFSYKVDIEERNKMDIEDRNKTSKAAKRYIMNKFIEEKFSDERPIYNGEDHLYSPIELAMEGSSWELPKYKDSDKEYTVTFHGEPSNIMNIPGGENGHGTVGQELLQKLDVVVKEHPRSSFMGQGFYKLPTFAEKETSHNYGITTVEGFSMSLRPMLQGVKLNVDYSVAHVHMEKTVVEYLKGNHILKENVEFKRSDLEKALTGLKVTVNHRQTRQKFTVVEVTEKAANDIKFKIDGGDEEKSIKDYYNDHYGKTIKYIELPCLNLGKKAGRQIYVPMEFCDIYKGQRVLKDKLNALQKVVEPSVRQNKIAEIMADKKGPTHGQHLTDFGITVHPEMTKVTARILDAPLLILGNGKLMTPSSYGRQWNMTSESKNTVFQGKNINSWGIIHFSENPNEENVAVKNIVEVMVNRFNEVGIKVMQKPIIFPNEAENTLNNAVKLKGTLEKHMDKNLEILICIMEGKHSGYKNLKFICETEIGLATQCCLFKHVTTCACPREGYFFNKDQNFASQYLANFALKVNAKLGGSNVVLSQSNLKQIPCIGDPNIVYFGADVNHPTNHDKNCPSIAAVVMSINSPESNRYVVRIQRQQHRQEIISNLRDMCYELLSEYAKTKTLPKRIIFFRDGVGDWQFDDVRKKELEALKDAFKNVNPDYNPQLTFILAQKRHHTRLFPESGDQNVPSGTVVDSAEIVHPSEVNFYLCSHHNNQGTSKATHYYVLFNEIGYSQEDFQTLIYHLCFTFATCTKPVKLVPPVYYADRAASRGRLYVEAERSVSSDLDSSLNVRLQGDNSMFFI